MKKRTKHIFVRCAFLFAMSFCLAMALPCIAFAEEQKSGIEVLLPDMNEFVPLIVAFIIVLIILSKFGFPVLANIIKKREDTIKESLEKSEEARIESERTLKEYQKKLDSARSQAHDIVYEAQSSCEDLRLKLTKEAQDQAAEIINKAKDAASTEKKIAASELQSSVADLVIAVCQRVVNKDFSDEDHRKLIEQCIQTAGSFNA